MATEKQIAANRRNAARSTGPRTTLGKGRSRMNALRHGLSYVGRDLPTLESAGSTDENLAATRDREAAIFEGLQQIRVERARMVAKVDELVSSANAYLVILTIKKIAAMTRYEGRLYAARKLHSGNTEAQSDSRSRKTMKSAKRTQFCAGRH
jgi:hypothetical protein